MPLPFPTTLSFPSLALNETFPFIRPKVEKKKGKKGGKEKIMGRKEEGNQEKKELTGNLEKEKKSKREKK